MSAIRWLLMIGIVVGAVWVSSTFVEHHHHPDIFQSLFSHLTPQPIVVDGHPVGFHVPSSLNVFTLDHAGHATGEFVLTNLQVFQIAAVLFILVAFSGVAGYLRTGRGDYVSKLLAGFVTWIRDEMVYPAMGKERGNKFLPFFLCLFFFILFMNLFGLVPGGSTATASVAVTGALATITFAAMIVCGMVAQGPIACWMNLVPHVPALLWPLMFVIEIIGLLVKPFALMIRLFANMTGGHLVVLSMMGLIMFFGARGASPVTGYGAAPAAVGMAVFIMIIETFVAFLQAYIFTQLSILFVQSAVHPEH